MDNKKITIIGAGSWGCALASLLKDNGHDILLYDNNIDIVVFNMSDSENLIRVINGDKIGTTIRKEF